MSRGFCQYPLDKWAKENARRWKWVLRNYGKNDYIPKHVGRPDDLMAISTWADCNGVSRPFASKLFKEGRLPQLVVKGTDRSVVIKASIRRKQKQRDGSMKTLNQGIKREMAYAKEGLDEAMRQLDRILKIRHDWVVRFKRQITIHRKRVRNLNDQLIRLRRATVNNQRYYLQRAMRVTGMGAVSEIAKLREELREKWKDYEKNEDAENQGPKAENAATGKGDEI